jgi:hypothetical protein
MVILPGVQASHLEEALQGPHCVCHSRNPDALLDGNQEIKPLQPFPVRYSGP